MKFRSRNKKPTRIASTTGHVVLVDQEWIDVPEHMEGDAYAAGCISEEMYDTIKNLDAPEGNKVNILELGERMGTVKNAINEMIEDDGDNFTKAGLPNLSILSARCGFTVPKKEMIEAWAEVAAERDEVEGD